MFALTSTVEKKRQKNYKISRSRAKNELFEDKHNSNFRSSIFFFEMSKANGVLIFAAYPALSTDWYQGCEGIC